MQGTTVYPDFNLNALKEHIKIAQDKRSVRSARSNGAVMEKVSQIIWIALRPGSKVLRFYHKPSCLLHQMFLITAEKRFECINGRKRKCQERFYNPKKNEMCQKCDRANKCPIKGMDAPIPCPIGTYQNMPKRTFCIDCPERKRCNETELQRPESCPKGFDFFKE